MMRSEEHHDAYSSGYAGFPPMSEDLTTEREAKLSRNTGSRELDFGFWMLRCVIPVVYVERKVTIMCRMYVVC